VTEKIKALVTSSFDPTKPNREEELDRSVIPKCQRYESLSCRKGGLYSCSREGPGGDLCRGFDDSSLFRPKVNGRGQTYLDQDDEDLHKLRQVWCLDINDDDDHDADAACWTMH
jgi:hypothetical protein